MDELTIQIFPPSGIPYARNLCFANTKFLGKHRSGSVFQWSILYFYNLVFGQLASDTTLPVLHCPMSSHVHLIIKVGRPAEIGNVIIRWISVIVSNIGMMPRRWISEKNKSNQPMAKKLLLDAVFISKSVFLVAMLYSTARKRFGLFSFSFNPVGMTPATRFLPPRTNFTKLIDVVGRVTPYFSPSGHKVFIW